MTHFKEICWYTTKAGSEIELQNSRTEIIVIKDLTLHDGGRYHIETSPLIYSANQWTGFYMIKVSVMKELNMPFLPILENYNIKPLSSNSFHDTE